MPKKKKGGKKKKAGKKAASASAEPKLSQMERFVRFSVETRTDQIRSWREQRDELKKGNAVLEQQLDTLKQKQQEAVHKLREKSSGTASELTQYEQELQQRIEDALTDKQTFVKEEERSIVGMRRKLKEMEQRIVSENETLQGLQVFQVVGQQENMKTIEELEGTVAQIKEEHKQELQDMSKRFQLARERFSANFDARVERTREVATENAIEIQSSRDKVAAAEREWLKRELDTHRAERQRVQVVCEELEKENLKLLASLYAENTSADGQWRGSPALRRHLEELGIRGPGGGDEGEEGAEEAEDEEEEQRGDDDSDDDERDPFKTQGPGGEVGQWRISARGDPVFVRTHVSQRQLFKEEQARRVHQLRTFGEITAPLVGTPRNKAASMASSLPQIRASQGQPSPRVQAVLAETAHSKRASPVRAAPARRWGQDQQQQQQQQHHQLGSPGLTASGSMSRSMGFARASRTGGEEGYRQRYQSPQQGSMAGSARVNVLPPLSTSTHK